MRQVNLAGVQYKIVGDITQRPINPWKAAIRQSGGLEYSDFSQAEVEEYYDFRNGIGLNRGVGSEARLQWSEGIDFTVKGQAVLGPLVTTTDYATWAANTAYVALDFVVPVAAHTVCFECTTAGTSHATTEPAWDTTVGNTTNDGTVVWTCRAYLSTLKIIDFQSKTYFFQNSRILKWNTSTSKLQCVHNSFATPIDVIVITDATDEYLVVTSATEAIYTTDGTTWTSLLSTQALGGVYTEVDVNNKLTVTTPKALAADADADEDVYLYKDMGVAYFNLLDIDFEIYCASTSETNARAGIAISNTVSTIKGFATTDISAIFQRDASEGSIKLLRGDTVANDSYTASDDTIYYCTLKRAEGSDTVRLKIYSDSARTTLVDTLSVSGFSTTTYRYIYGFVNYNTTTANRNFDGYVQNLNTKEVSGYLADYTNRLYCISTDGNTVRYSTSEDIDAKSGAFELTGNYGTVYALFEGKLLSDGTPTLYFCGTQGLYTVDTTTELAYKQEVSYPPLTYSGHAGLYWNANVWVATGYGILKVASSTATEIGPNQDDGLDGTHQGYIWNMIPVNNWLVYSVHGLARAKSSIMKRNASYGGSLQVYTTAATTDQLGVIYHSNSELYTNGRLWFGEDGDIKYMMFPDITSNPKHLATYTYVDDSGYGYLPIFRKLANISKTALGISAITKSCDTNEYVALAYGINGAAATTAALGTFKSSPRAAILTFGSGLGTEFYTIQFAIKLFRGTTTTNSPELESLMFYYLPTPATISGFTFRIEATEDNSDAIITQLEAIRDTKTLVAFYPTGDTAKTGYYVKLTTMPLRFWSENQKSRQGYIQVDVQQIFNG